MKWVDTIKKMWGEVYLQAKLKKAKHKAEFVNWESASSIGIVYVLDEEKTYRFVENFVKSNSLLGKDIKAIGIVKHKKDMENYLPKLSFDFIYQKDLNWFGKPQGQAALNFQANNFDLLIDVSTGEDYPAKYIFLNAKAKLKIAQFEQADVRIGRLEKDNLAMFFKNIAHYLTLLKTQ
jgi:Family of unknown function (DUF6913)